MLKYSNQKNFSLSLPLWHLSLPLSMTLKEKLQYESQFHKFLPFAELSILGFLSIFSQVLGIMMEIRIEQLLCDKAQYDKIVLQYIKESVTHFKQMHFKVF